MKTDPNTLILAIDLGKYKSVACVYAPASSAGVGQERTLSFETTAAALTRLVRREGPAVVVIEACALAGWVSDLCAELGVPCKVANTLAEAWKFKHSRRKTDQDDARRLAQLEALGQLPTVTVPGKATRQHRALIGARQALVCRRVALQNRLRGILLGQGLAAPRGHRAWTAAGLAGLAAPSRRPCRRPDRRRKSQVRRIPERFAEGTRRVSPQLGRAERRASGTQAVRNEGATRRIWTTGPAGAARRALFEKERPRPQLE